MISRDLEPHLRRAFKNNPAVYVTGPRQSGKTTLVRRSFPDLPYRTLEEPDVRAYAMHDPRGFLADLQDGAILDEAQRAPDLFSYLQSTIDAKRRSGLFVLTGSQNFLLDERISQSLAGRIAIFTLHPFGLAELARAGRLKGDLADCLIRGFYPRLFAARMKPREWYPSYIRTYVERDVRLLKNVNDLEAFQRFIRLCAGRTGRIVNLSSLGNDCGITHNTVRAWLSVLVASHLVFLLRPHFRNFTKRLVKSPKLYFHDSGLACSLLGIRSAVELKSHYLLGGLFEGFVISEFMKRAHHAGEEPRLHYFRDNIGNEVDCLLERAGRTIPIEIKAGRTVAGDFFRGLDYYRRVAGENSERGYVIYGGDDVQRREAGRLTGWRSLEAWP